MDGSRRTKPIDFLDGRLFAQHEEQMALLKVLALGQEEIEQGKFRDAEAVFAELEQEDRRCSSAPSGVR